MHFEQHAEEVVNRFKRMLSDETIEQVSEEHFAELKTLIAASLGVVDSANKHDFAKRLEVLAHEFRQGSSKSD